MFIDKLIVDFPIDLAPCPANADPTDSKCKFILSYCMKRRVKVS